MLSPRRLWDREGAETAITGAGGACPAWQPVIRPSVRPVVAYHALCGCVCRCSSAIRPGAARFSVNGHQPFRIVRFPVLCVRRRLGRHCQAIHDLCPVWQSARRLLSWRQARPVLGICDLLLDLAVTEVADTVQCPWYVVHCTASPAHPYFAAPALNEAVGVSAADSA